MTTLLHWSQVRIGRQYWIYLGVTLPRGTFLCSDAYQGKLVHVAAANPVTSIYFQPMVPWGHAESTSTTLGILTCRTWNNGQATFRLYPPHAGKLVWVGGGTWNRNVRIKEAVESDD